MISACFCSASATAPFGSSFIHSTSAIRNIKSTIQFPRCVSIGKCQIVRATLDAEGRPFALTSSTATSDASSSSTTSIAAYMQSHSFGRGKRFPRRLVGLYELQRIGVNTDVVIESNSRDEAALSAGVGVMVFSVILLPLLLPNVNVETPVAIAIGAALIFWAIDTLSLDSLFSRALSAAFQSRRRVSVHEAGHFLVAHLLGIPVMGYTLLTPKRVLQNATVTAENGLPLGVQVRAKKETSDEYALAAVGMAGIAAEIVCFGACEGGAEDMEEVARVARNAARKIINDEDMKRICRWGLMQSMELLKDHRNALEKLADCLTNDATVEECFVEIDKTVDAAKLA